MTAWQIEQIRSDVAASPKTLSILSLTALTHHIEATHHAYLHKNLPSLEALINQVVFMHGHQNSQLLQLQETFLVLSSELHMHLLKEEQIVFPTIRQLDTRHRFLHVQCGTLTTPMQRMDFEDIEVGKALTQLRRLTHRFTPPQWASQPYRTMLHALSTFEQDMHQHIYAEMQVLFPRVMSVIELS